MRGPRTVRKPDDHQQQQQSSASSSSSALARRTEQQRKKIGITSTKAKGFTAQQQQQSSSTATLEDPKKKNRLNFDEGDGDQPVINNHVHQQHQNNDQTFVNVTTCTEGVVEYSISPSVSPTRPKRKAAQAAALLFQQQRKPKRRAQLDKENGKTGKQLRQKRKNNNRKVNPRTLITVDSNVPAKVQPILVDDRQKYSVQAVLAVFTLPVPIGCARLPQKGFFIKWRGYDGQDSWVLSADAFCLEMACSFSEKTGMDAAFDAMLGNELPLHFINELQKSSKFERVKALYRVPELRQSGLDIAWADGATQ
uniref:Chromo domain-containing protein n=1 Tax=Globodera pallida TaxID=36090 RepID=A0A183BP64_GLOPA